MNKVNIDECYIALIYRLTCKKSIDLSCKIRNLEMIKFSLIKEEKINQLDIYYKDLIDGKIIYTEKTILPSIGSLHVRDVLIPINTLIKTKNKRIKKSKLIKSLKEPLIELNKALYNKVINTKTDALAVINENQKILKK